MQALAGHYVFLAAERRHGALRCQGRFLETGLQMVRGLWEFDPETAVAGYWAWYYFGAILLILP